MSKISVLLNTYRTGGVDVSLYGLSRQTFTDFEVIFVDTHYDMRKDAVKEYNEKLKVPLVHVAPARDQTPLDSGSKHRNSAIMLAEGELCIFLCDFGYTKPDWLQKHWDAYQNGNGATAMGPHRYWIHPEIKTTWATEPISLFKNDFTPYDLVEATGPGTQDPKLTHAGGPIDGTFFHLKNEAVKLDALLAMNGCDEGYDENGGHCYSDTDMGLRAATAGNPFILDPTNIVEIVQIRDFYPFLKRNRTVADDYNYFLGRKGVIDKGIITANDFNISDLRQSMLVWKHQQHW